MGCPLRLNSTSRNSLPQGNLSATAKQASNSVTPKGCDSSTFQREFGLYGILWHGLPAREGDTAKMVVPRCLTQNSVQSREFAPPTARIP